MSLVAVCVILSVLIMRLRLGEKEKEAPLSEPQTVTAVTCVPVSQSLRVDLTVRSGRGKRYACLRFVGSSQCRSFVGDGFTSS